MYHWSDDCVNVCMHMCVCVCAQTYLAADKVISLQVFRDCPGL